MKNKLIILLSLFAILAVSCESSSVDNNEESFYFTFGIYASNNSVLQGNNISLSTDEEGNYYGTTVTPCDLSALKATFTTSGSKVYVAGVLQESRVTPNDFTEEVIYTIEMSNGDSHTVKVNISSFEELPTMYINTDGGVAIESKDYYVSATVSITGNENFPAFESTSVSIKGRGNSTWWLSDKKPYKLKFDTKQSLGGMPEDKTWALLANYSDKTALRGALAFTMSELTAMEYTPRYDFINVILNGSYRGTYQLIELRKISEGRVNLSDEGYLLEVDQLDRLDYDDVYFTTSRGVLINIKDSDDVEFDTPEYEWVRDYIQEAEDALFSGTFTDTEEGYAKYFDLDCLADWFLVNELSKNVDAKFYSSCFMNIEPGEKIKMGPVWDFDLAFGNCNYDDCYSTEGFQITKGLWYARLFQDPAFIALLRERFEIIVSQRENLLTMVDTMADKLTYAQNCNNDKWQTFGIYVWPNYVWFDTYEEEVDYLKEWFEKRLDWFELTLSTL